ncbi:hypothetical protein [Bacillus licheniformis]|uniref:hypothetical protein n=1 Tax=Bacillus licheniformis TaxID=1402 RepID=UPI001B20916E|nr:hypothetical protein [Bacillus licheniformis]GIN25609.1 hypothetical protein J31TS2_21890 [Bacillus licheniformis]GIN29652.1 hypothetical protein J2TS5_16910 [Bacillus licheniformis]
MIKYTFLGKVEKCEYYAKESYFGEVLINKETFTTEYKVITTKSLHEDIELVNGTTVFLNEINKEVQIEDIVREIDGGFRIYTDYVIESKLSYKSVDKAINDLENKYNKKIRSLVDERDEIRRSYKKLKFFNLYKKLK